MPRQAQVDAALQKALDHKPSSGKLSAVLRPSGLLELHHYQHLLLRWDTNTRRST